MNNLQAKVSIDAKTLLANEYDLQTLERKIISQHIELQTKSAEIRTLLLKYISILTAERDELIEQLKFKNRVKNAVCSQDNYKTFPKQEQHSPLFKVKNGKRYSKKN